MKKSPKNSPLQPVTHISPDVLPIGSLIPQRQVRGRLILGDQDVSSNLEVLLEIYGASHCLLLQCRQANSDSAYLVSKLKSKTESLIQFTVNLGQQYQSSLTQGNVLIFSNQDNLTPIPVQKQLKKHNIDSALLLPLNCQNFDKVVIGIYHCEKEYCWLEKDLGIILKIALQSLALIETTKQLNRYQCQMQKRFLFQQINNKLNSNLSSKELFKEIFCLIGNNFDFEQIFLVQVNNNQIIVSHKWKQSPNLSRDFNDEEFLQNCLRSELIKVSQQFCQISLNSQKINLVSLPIMVKEQFFGLLVLETENCERQLKTTEIENLEYIVEQIAIAIYHEQSQEFLDETVHELRNPLVGILGCARVLEEQIYGTLNDKQLQYVSLIANSGEYLRDLINDFLDLSRVDADQEELYLEKFAVEDLCLASLALFRERASEQGLDLRLKIGENIDFCRADSQRLKQILVNLLSNAIKFTEMGFVTLKVERQGDQLAFSIIDTGIGIAPEDQKKLFRPFGQIKKHPLTRKHKGSGLGLALSRKLAQLHGGDITLTSEIGKGTCLTVVIPLRAESDTLS